MNSFRYEDRWVLIANPVCGRGQKQRAVDRALRQLQEAGHTAEVMWTVRQGHAEELATIAVRQRATHIVACGGDGTIHEIINGIMVARPAKDAVVLGIVPLGRANDLARMLNIPRGLNPAIQTLLGNTIRTIDLGKVGGRYFVTVATLGFDTMVAEYVADGRQPRFLVGTMAYFYGALVNLLRYEPVWVRLNGDLESFEGSAFLAAVGNTSTYGGGLKITPAAEVDDGKLDLCLVQQISRLDVVRMLPGVYSGRHIRHPKVSIQCFQKMEVTTKVPAAIWADGEPIAQTPTVFEAVSKALDVIAD